MAEKLNLGDRVMTLRVAAHWSQAEFARRAGIDKATLNRIETGKNKNPSQATLQKIAKALGISLGALLDPQARIVVGGRKSDLYLPENLKLVLEDMEAQLREAMNLARDALAVGRDARAIAERLERQFGRRGRRTVAS